MNDPAAQEEVTFGPFTLCPAERRLTRDGAAVPLAARALDILTALVASGSEPLNKRDLLARVWPDATVGEASLRFHVANLRKALGDGQDGARYIETLSGRGYCFVAPVSRTSPTFNPAPSYSWTGNLPSRPPLIGRDEDLAGVADLLGHERLVTIVGPGGVGKTRLAIAAGWQAADDYPDGVWLVDLAPLTDPSLVVSAVATALDLARGASQLSVDLIVSALGDRRLLLILDNCEYLADATAELAGALTGRITGLTVLATSQESLRLDVERVYRLGPLDLPPLEALEVAGYGAVALFAHRARAADRRFELNAGNAAPVAEICRSLDGLPLALEMAAARAPSLGVEGLRASLGARLHMLSGGLRTPDVRHQTLRRTVEWSIGLLDDTEALVFRRLGIFSGGFLLEAAMTVASEGAIDRWVVADTLSRLVDKSMVTVERGERPRYRLLETLRLYARELLEAGGEWDRLSERHARHFVEAFSGAAHAWETIPSPEWQSIYLVELDNLRSALAWALAEPSRFDLAVQLSGSTNFMWHEWGMFAEGRTHLTRVRDRLDDHAPSAPAAAIVRSVAALLAHFGDPEGEERECANAAEISRRAGDGHGVARAQLQLSLSKLHADRYSEIGPAMHGVCEALSAKGEIRSLSSALGILGALAAHDGDAQGSIAYLTRAAAISKQLKDLRREASMITNLAIAEFSRGNVDRAIELGRESVDLIRSLPYRRALALYLENLAMYLVAADRLDEARPVAEEALTLVPVQAASIVLLRHLQQWALIAALEGQSSHAARVIGWVDAAYERLGVPRNSWEVTSYERLLAQLRAHLSVAELAVFAAEGAAWDAEAAVRFTFEHIIRPGASDPDTASA